MKAKRKAAVIILMVLAAGIASGSLLIRAAGKSTIDRNILDNLGADKVKKVMIVAHPDDETIWGGGHLQDGGYLVVCLTNGNNATRKAEFIQAVEMYDNIPCILSYPDKLLGIRSHWLLAEDNIRKDLKEILAYQDWEEIVTHNPEGEYGHIQHKRSSSLVTETADNCQMKDNLWYFGKYYKADEEELIKETALPEEVYEKKISQCEVYASQDFIWDKFGHMFAYEAWYQIK